MRRLLIRPGAIGDVIVSLPAMEALKTGHLEVWTRTPNVPLVRFANRVRPIAATGLDLLGIREAPAGLVEELRGFDSIISWYGANRPEFRDLTAQLGLPFEFLPALPRAWPGHACDYYLEQVGAPAGGCPRIPCAAPARGTAVIQPFAGSSAKRWPMERFHELAARLAMPVEWCAGPEDAALPGAMRFDDLYQLACWLAGASLFIGNDSGISHLAAAVGTPVVALFGPTDPRLWAPRGPDVRIVSASSMRLIGVEEVIATIRDRCTAP